jgi:pimeloyl-ACP methyl ester carboxylesterase
MSPIAARRTQEAGTSMVREGLLHGALPYLAIGAGPPLVVLPGLSAENGNPTGMARSFQLRPLQPLARHFTVYAVNRKRGLQPGTTIEDLADEVADTLDHRFPGPVCVQGVSTGGSIAQQLAIDHPELIRRLVLASTACRLSSHGRQVQRQLAHLANAGRPRRAWATYGPALAATTAGGQLFATLMWLFGGRMGSSDPSDMVTTIAAEDMFDAGPRLHRITAPTLVIAGERDRFYSPELFRETATRIPDARLCLYPGKGHATALTHRRAVRDILGFLTEDQPR